jgi:diguanylate cyclase
MVGQYWEEAKHAEKLAGQANGLLSSSGFVPTPGNYELCFFYALGQNRELKDAVDAVIRDGRAHEIATSHDLHRKFFSAADHAEVAEAGAVFERELKKLASSLASTNSGSANFSRTLENAADQFLRSDVPQPLRDLLDNVATATKVMADTNKRLEAQVEASGREVTALQSKMAVVRRESLSDALTGLDNRRSFDEQIVIAAAEAGTTGAPLSVLMCDIDHFKKFNDNWGHATGDQVLRLVASCVSGNVKGRDTAARYGGEELVVILPNTNLRDALVVAEQIRKSVESRKIIKKSTGESYGTITLSIGAAELKASEPVDSLMGRADACLYGAKHAGRNRVNGIAPQAAQPVPSNVSSLSEGQGRGSRAAGSMMELEFHDQHTELFVDPEVVLVDARLKRLHGWWLKSAQNGLPVWKQTLLTNPALACDMLHLHKVCDDGERFKVMHVSPGLTRLLGQDTTGMFLTSTPSSVTALGPTLSRVFEVAKLTFKMKTPMRTFSKTTHVLPNGKFRGESLCLPMSDAGKSIDYILIASAFVPEG